MKTANLTHHLLLPLLLLSLVSPCGAQSIQHDRQKEKQWRSMETGPWDFEPGWYYYLLHNGYSGAYLKWEWHGLKSGLRVRFKESKSDVRTVMPVRTLAEEEERLTMDKAEEERQQIEPLYREELAREADRTVDLVYADYRDDFDRMQQSISEGLLYCMQKSGGRLNSQVSQLQRQNDLICSSIAYIHKTGPGYELENAKREKAYIDYRKQMEELVSRVAHLVGMAQRYYK
jgi:hypothetical protein